MKPHKHSELIKAWADGATIQVKYTDAPQYWVDKDYPTWHPKDQYRIKPEPKPDVVKSYAVAYGGAIYEVFKYECSNLKLTFDGETGELKYAEVLK